MDKEQTQINEFIKAAGKSYPTNGPEIPKEEVIKFRINFILEELQEFASACGYELEAELSVKHGIEEQQVRFPQAMDALGDLTYVVKGAYSAFGVDGGPIFQIVHKANMTKFGPGGYLNAAGKWVKPPTFVPPEPEIEKELHRQKVAARHPELSMQEIYEMLGAGKYHDPQPMVPSREDFPELYENNLHDSLDDQPSMIETMRGENHAL